MDNVDMWVGRFIRLMFVLWVAALIALFSWTDSEGNARTWLIWAASVPPAAVVLLIVGAWVWDPEL